jgi:hypothetical protein
VSQGPASAAVQAGSLGSQADFARSQGWQKSYVTKLKGEGRLVFTDDGLVDFAASLARIGQTTGAPERAAPAVQGITYSTSQERERFYSAELKRLELERETKKVLEASDVASVVADAGAIFRAGVEAWRDRLPPQLAALGADEQRIAAMMADECEQLLRRVSERFEALASRGAAQ